MKAYLKGDPVGSTRLAAADDRINRALADAVERHATEDPGVRGILKRASVVCHPESESQKKNLYGRRAGPNTPSFSLTRRIISVRHRTQHHH